MTTFQINTFGQLEESNDLLGDAVALREKLGADGYLFLRDVIDANAVATYRRALLAIMAEHGYAEPGDEDMVWTRKTPAADDPLHMAMRESSAWRDFVADPSMLRICRVLFDGDEPWWLNTAILRYNPPSRTLDDPSRPGGRPPVHQDDVGLYGIPNVRTFWNPLVEIDEAMGGMAVAPKTNKLGMLYHDNTLMIPEEDIPTGSWLRAVYRPGDVLIITGSTVHTGLPNHTENNRIRLSLDCRAMPASDPRPAFLAWSSKRTADFTRHARTVLNEENVPQAALQDAFFAMRDREVDPDDRAAVRALIEELSAG